MSSDFDDSVWHLESDDGEIKGGEYLLAEKYGTSGHDLVGKKQRLFRDESPEYSVSWETDLTGEEFFRRLEEDEKIPGSSKAEIYRQTLEQPVETAELESISYSILDDVDSDYESVTVEVEHNGTSVEFVQNPYDDNIVRFRDSDLDVSRAVHYYDQSSGDLSEAEMESSLQEILDELEEHSFRWE